MTWYFSQSTKSKTDTLYRSFGLIPIFILRVSNNQLNINVIHHKFSCLKQNHSVFDEPPAPLHRVHRKV